MSTLLEKINIKYKQVIGDNMEVFIGDSFAV